MSTEDPGSLRYVAGQLRALADEICARIDRAASAVRGIVYEGPAGDSLRQVVTASAAGVHAEAQLFYDLARRLDQTAYEVELQRQREQQGGLT